MARCLLIDGSTHCVAKGAQLGASSVCDVNSCLNYVRGTLLLVDAFGGLTNEVEEVHLTIPTYFTKFSVGVVSCQAVKPEPK